MSLRQNLYNEIQRATGLMPGGQLEILAYDWGYKPSTAGRVLRKMVENKEIEVDKGKGFVRYSIPKTQGILI